MLCIGGPPGSGKTTLGEHLATHLRLALVDLDTATNPLMEQVTRAAGLPYDLDDRGLRGPVRRARYRCVLDLAAHNARVGVGTILIAPLTQEVSSETAWHHLVTLVEPGRAVLVWLTIDPEVGLARRQDRGQVRDASVRAHRGVSPVVPALRLDGADNVWDNGSHIITHLGGGSDDI